MAPDCYRIRDRFSELLDNLLDPREQARLQAHLERCERCAGEFELLRKSHAMVRSLEPIEVPSDFTDRVLARVRLQPDAAPGQAWIPSIRAEQSALRHFKISLAAAAAVAALVAGVWVWKTTPRMNSASAPVANSAATPHAAAGKLSPAPAPEKAPALAVQSPSGTAPTGKARLRTLPHSRRAPALAGRVPTDSIFDQPYQGGEIVPAGGYIHTVQSLPDSGVHVMPASPGRNPH